VVIASQESERSCNFCVRVSILSLSTILIYDLGTVPTEWYFFVLGTVPTVWYFFVLGTVPTVWYFFVLGTVPTVWYFFVLGTVPSFHEWSVAERVERR
jgi:hypothetical protein